MAASRECPPESHAIFNYFERIQCRILPLQTLSYAQQVDYLNHLYHQHVQSAPFFNFDLREISHAHPLTRKSLTLFDHQRIKQGYDGGYCFQTTIQIYEALKHLGFKVHCCIAKVLNGLQPDSIQARKIPATHLIICVTINDTQYMIDPSLGMSGVCGSFVMNKDSAVYNHNNHLFKIDRSDDGYIFYKVSNQEWVTVMQFTLSPANEKMIQTQLLKLERFPVELGIRDVITLVGIATASGAKTLLWLPAQNTFMLRTISADSSDTEEQFTDINKAFNLLRDVFKIRHISQVQFEHYCSPNRWPKPIHSLEINFPIDKKEVMQLKQCYRL